MKVVVILGSRNPEGQTVRAADALLGAMEGEGWEGVRFFLPQMKVERCRQCDENGWGICRTEGRCEVEQDQGGRCRGLRHAGLLQRSQREHARLS